MVTIRIAEHVKQASTYDDGQVIFDLISPRIIGNEPVEVSFAGIQAVPSAFVNAAFLQLLEVAPLEAIQRNLKISDSTKFINELIKQRFEFVTSGKKAV